MAKLLLWILVATLTITCKSRIDNRSEKSHMKKGEHWEDHVPNKQPVDNEFDNPHSEKKANSSSLSLTNTAPASPPWSAVVELKHANGTKLRPIHAALLPDGQVFYITGTEDYYTGRSPVFSNAEMSQMTSITLNESAVPFTDPANEALYCSGHAFDSAGNLFTAGGITPHPGNDYSYNFSYRDGKWHQISQPMVGIGANGTFRYYPTTTLLHDGRLLVTASAKYPNSGYNRSMAIYNPDTKSWGIVSHDPDYSPNAAVTTPMDIVPQGGSTAYADYPHVFLMPTDDVSRPKVIIFSSPANPVIFEFDHGVWGVQNNLRPHLPQDLDQHGNRIPNANNPNGGATSAMLPLRLNNGEWGYNNGSVFMASGNHFTSFKGRADVYDPVTNSWNGPTSNQTIQLGVQRHHPTVVTLPDGRMFIVNGHAMDGNVSSEKAQYIDPANGFSVATENIPQQMTRGYHNIALLLPDGRILIGCGRPNAGANNTEKQNFLYYSPDYMTKPRANLTSQPQAVSRNVPFTVSWEDESSNPGWGSQGIREAVLMALGTVTHSINMGQRYIEISVQSQSGNLVTLNVGSNPTYAPPGYYILYLLNGGRVPTYGKIVRLVNFDLADVPDLDGQWLKDNNVTSISQNGIELIFTNETGGTTPGYFMSANKVIAEGWGLMAASYTNNRLNWDNGTHWTKPAPGEVPNLAGNWKAGNVDVRIDQSGSTLTFYNEHGSASPGSFNSYFQVVATGWGNLIGNIQGDQITWANNAVWIKSNEPDLDLAGDWRTGNADVRIEQSGTNLTFFNEHGGSSAGHFTGRTRVVATGWGNLTGEVSGDTLTWSNGAVWTKPGGGSFPDISGDWKIGNLDTRIEQSGSSLTFFNEHGTSAAGQFNSQTEVIATGWGGLTATVAFGRIYWANNTVWQRPGSEYPDLSGDWTTGSADTRIEQNGASLTFINEHGGSSPGQFNSQTQVVATGWGELVGNLVGNSIEWTNGGSWTKK